MQHIPSSAAVKKSNRQSKLFSWIFTQNHDTSLSAAKEDDNKEISEECSTKIELKVNDYSQQSNQELQIPNRRQSNLYTPYHFDSCDSKSIDNYNAKRRSYLPPVYESSSSLTRSATWQPSTPKQPKNTQINNNLQVDDIPTRRTSRNYTDNPEIQAKLNAVLNSDRTNYLSHMIQQKQHKQN